VQDPSAHPGRGRPVILGENGPLRAELESLGVAVEVMALPTDLGGTRRAEPVNPALSTCRPLERHSQIGRDCGHRVMGHSYRSRSQIHGSNLRAQLPFPCGAEAAGFHCEPAPPA
jgi:hypothetical protein